MLQSCGLQWPLCSHVLSPLLRPLPMMNTQIACAGVGCTTGITTGVLDLYEAANHPMLSPALCLKWPLGLGVMNRVSSCLW